MTLSYDEKEFCYNSDIFRSTLSREVWIPYMKIQTARIALSAPAQLHFGLCSHHLAFSWIEYQHGILSPDIKISPA